MRKMSPGTVPVTAASGRRDGRRSLLDKSAAGFPFLIYRTGMVPRVHAHDHDFWELVYIQTGHGTCELGDGTFTFGSRQLILTPPFMAHEFRCSRRSKHRQTSIAVYPHALARLEILRVRVSALLNRIQKSGKLCVNVPQSEVAVVEGALEVIGREFTLQPPDYREMICVRIVELLILMHRLATGVNNGFREFGELPESISAALRFMEQNYQEIGSLRDIMRGIDAKFNPRYFIRMFRKHVGFTPIQYLNRVRIEKSTVLLLNTANPVSHVALDVGFGDLRFFNRQFRRFTGCTPRELRERGRIMDRFELG